MCKNDNGEVVAALGSRGVLHGVCCCCVVMHQSSMHLACSHSCCLQVPILG